MNLAPHVVRLLAALLVTVLLGACSTPSWMPSWLGGKPGPAAEPAKLVEFTPTLTPRIAWRASVGSSKDAFLQPAVLENAIFAASGGGAVVRLGPNGETVWRVETDVALTGETNEPTGPFGAKSLSEPCITVPAPAIANAIYNAVGVRIRELPITPE